MSGSDIFGQRSFCQDLFSGSLAICSPVVLVALCITHKENGCFFLGSPLIFAMYHMILFMVCTAFKIMLILLPYFVFQDFPLNLCYQSLPFWRALHCYRKIPLKSDVHLTMAVKGQKNKSITH